MFCLLPRAAQPIQRFSARLCCPKAPAIESAVQQVRVTRFACNRFLLRCWRCVAAKVQQKNCLVSLIAHIAQRHDIFNESVIVHIYVHAAKLSAQRVVESTVEQCADYIEHKMAQRHALALQISVILLVEAFFERNWLVYALVQQIGARAIHICRCSVHLERNQTALHLQAHVVHWQNLRRQEQVLVLLFEARAQQIFDMRRQLLLLQKSTKRHRSTMDRSFSIAKQHKKATSKMSAFDNAAEQTEIDIAPELVRAHSFSLK